CFLFCHPSGLLLRLQYIIVFRRWLCSHQLLWLIPRVQLFPLRCGLFLAWLSVLSLMFARFLLVLVVAPFSGACQEGYQDLGGSCVLCAGPNVALIIVFFFITLFLIYLLHRMAQTAPGQFCSASLCCSSS